MRAASKQARVGSQGDSEPQVGRFRRRRHERFRQRSVHGQFTPDPGPTIRAGAGVKLCNASAAPAPPHNAHTRPTASLAPARRVRGAQPT
jgi:hypothetical protein